MSIAYLINIVVLLNLPPGSLHHHLLLPVHPPSSPHTTPQSATKHSWLQYLALKHPEYRVFSNLLTFTGHIQQKVLSSSSVSIMISQIAMFLPRGPIPRSSIKKSSCEGKCSAMGANGAIRPNLYQAKLQWQNIENHIISLGNV